MSQKISIDVIIIAKNEQSRIADCIRAASWADHVYVVDNNSSDGTAGVARDNGATVIRCDSDNFSDIRTVGAARTTAPWLLYIDADELITPPLADEIRSVTRGNTPAAAYFLPRKNYYLGYPWPYMDGMVRLIKRNALLSWEGRLHEHAKINGRIGKLKNFVQHNTHRTLEEMVEKTNRWSVTEAELRFRQHHPEITWWRLLRVMATGFWHSYIAQGGWKAGVVGWIESIFQAFSMFITYAKLWELQNKKK